MAKADAPKFITNDLAFHNLTDLQILELHQAALSILEKTGVRVENGRAAELLAGSGARVELEKGAWRVRLPEAAVAQALERAPRNLVCYGRSPEHDYRPGPGRVGFSPGGVNPNLIDPRTRRLRPAGRSDADDLAVILNRLPLMTTVSEALVIGDVPARVSPAASAASLIKHTEKFVMVFPGDLDNCRAITAMAEAAAGGPEKLRSRPFLALAWCPLSPLTFDHDGCEAAMFGAEAGVYSLAINGVLAGATGPMSPEGAAALTVAELWAALCLSQAARPGALTQLATFSNAMSMRTGLAGLGAPEAAYIAAAAARVTQHFGFYGHHSCGFSDSKTTDAQMGYEFAANVLFMALSGASLISGMGALEGGLTFDYAKLLLDHECALNLAAMMRGYRPTPEELALEVIDQVGPRGGYLNQRHTFQRARLLSDHELFDRGPRGAWERRGAPTAVDRAYAKALSLMESPPRLLDRNREDEIENILAELIAKAAGA